MTKQKKGVNYNMKNTIIKKTILIAGAVAAMLAFAACAPAAQSASASAIPAATTQADAAAEPVKAEKDVASITVSANESVKVKPDLAYVDLGVKTTGTSSQDAQQKNAAAATAMLDALKAQGIAEDDIKTSYMNMYQDYQDPTMYAMENTFNVTIRDINNVGKVIDAAIAAGANSSYSLSFDISNRDAVYLEALGKAMKSVGAKAEAVAKSGGYTITSAKDIVENGSSSYAGKMMESGVADMAAAGAAPTPVSPGDIEVSASVTGTYNIK